MKSKSLFIFMLSLVSKFFLWIIVLLCLLSFYFFVNSYDRNLGIFYSDVNNLVFQEEKNYDLEIKKVQSYLILHLKKLQKSIKKGLKNNWIENLDEKQVSKSIRRLDLRARRKKVLSQKYLFRFQKLSKNLTKKYPFVDARNLRFTFHDLAIANKLLAFYTTVSSSTSNEVIASVSNGSSEKNVADILPDMFTNLFARRLSYSDKIDFLFSAPSKILFKIDIDPYGTKFQQFKFLNKSFYFFYSGFTADKGKEQAVFNIEKLAHIKSKNRFIGFLSCTIDMQYIYRSFMERIENKNWNHRLIDAYNFKTEFRSFMDPNQKIDILDQNTLQVKEKNKDFFATIIEYFKNKQNIKYTYINKDGKQIYSSMQFDGLLKTYAHLFETESDKLSEPIYQDLKTFSQYVGLILLILLGIGFFGTLFLTRPITRLRQIIDSYKSDFNTDKFNNFDHGSSEIRMLKNSILNQVNSINRNIQIMDGLHTMYDAIAQKRKADDFHNLTVDLLERLFRAHCIEQVDGASFSISSPKQTTYFKVNSYLNNAELRPFIEQYQLYFQRDELRAKYLTSIVQKKQFELAEEAQKDLMPKNDISNPNICSFYKAARFLGGDFYDNFSNEMSEYYIIADVSGKGLAASLYGLLVKSYLMSLMHNTTGQSTSSLLAKLNGYLIKQKKGNFFCTLFLAKYDIESKLLEYASAGHNKMIVKDSSKMELLSTKGLPIGMMDMDLYESKTYEVKDESLLFLYTDGVTEAENQNLELYGDDKLYEFLETFHYNDPYLLSTRIEQDLNLFCGNAVQSDDITFVSIKLEGSI